MEFDTELTIISSATKRNWLRLNQNEQECGRLIHRANKKKSTKTIFPKEYLSNPSNINAILDIMDTISRLNVSVKEIICSLCVNVLIQHELIEKRQGQWEFRNQYLRSFFDEIRPYIFSPLLALTLPVDEKDIIGFIYQCLLSEGHKNVQGTYFTPREIIRKLINNIDTKKQPIILDPCCGTGSFLVNIEGIKPENIYGIDIDPLAVIIGKTNLYVRYKEKNFQPNIFCADFLTLGHTLYDTVDLPELFDLIISNPPWGASVTKEYDRYYPEITSGESFSFFLKQSIRKLKQNGRLCFLLPESILNVHVHKDIRKLLLEKTSICKLSLFGRSFSGVFTPVVGLDIVNRRNDENIVTIETSENLLQCPQEHYLRNDHYVFTIVNEMDQSIIDTIYSQPYRTLSKSEWALGIVTGNNKDKIHTTLQPGMEPIYTGKDVQRYTLKKPTSYIKYDRSSFQQVAPDEFYRSGEKLVYKFISNRLVFAYDQGGSLFLNSANILIPKIEEMSIKTVLAFLNSTVMQFLYLKKFGEIKVLRGNLEKLPLPIIDSDLDTQLAKLVDSVMEGNIKVHDEIQQLIYAQWRLTDEQILYIEESVNG